MIKEIHAYLPKAREPLDLEEAGFVTLGKLVAMPFTERNKVTLLSDGETTFDLCFKEFKQAKRYILIQFFIIREDELGMAFQHALLECAKAGVQVYLLYDAIGCYKVSKAYFEKLQKAGVMVEAFKISSRRYRFQINFRNHRKVIVIDGKTAFTGGLNVGNEYLGKDPRFGPWRDSFVKVTGPAVQFVQLAFVEDWYWERHEIPSLNWKPTMDPSANERVLVLPTGPSDDFETCSLLFVHAIHSAKHRIWLSSPYFVPDQKVYGALKLAALRGVDVRVMLPSKPDHRLVYLSAFAYFEEAGRAGVKFYRYQPGFLHQKSMLLDDRVATIGTANIDNRSFRLNFEITLLFTDPGFVKQIETSFEKDFAVCKKEDPNILSKRSFWFRLGVRVAYLLAPVQ